VRLAEIEPPGNDARRFAIVRAISLFIINRKKSICTVRSAYINLEGGFEKN
jgi:hypothetical protein